MRHLLVIAVLAAAGCGDANDTGIADDFGCNAQANIDECRCGGECNHGFGGEGGTGGLAGDGGGTGGFGGEGGSGGVSGPVIVRTPSAECIWGPLPDDGCSVRVLPWGWPGLDPAGDGVAYGVLVVADLSYAEGVPDPPRVPDRIEVCSRNDYEWIEVTLPDGSTVLQPTVIRVVGKCDETPFEVGDSAAGQQLRIPIGTWGWTLGPGFEPAYWFTEARLYFFN